MKKTYKSEKTAQQKILEYLNSVPGCSFDKKQASQYGNTNGFSDIVGVIQGHAIYIEVKSETGEPSDLQMFFLKKKKACGAYGGFAKSIQDAFEICNDGFGCEFQNKGWVK